MKNSLLGLLLTFTFTFTFADVIAKSSSPPLPSNPTVKPIVKPIVKPSYDRLTRDNYDYNPLYNDKEIAQEKALAKKREKIRALEKELNATRSVEYKALQKRNKAQYDKAMEKVNNRKSTIKTESSIIISDKPIK